VHPSFIRTEADELTYPLHVVLRFEIEQQLIRGTLHVKDLPSMWNKRMHDLLGITPKNDAEGCLQDIHWSQGGFGYFPTYVLGSMLSAQLWATIRKQVPNAEEQLRHGKTDALLHWLREHVHKHGATYTTNELIKKATGKPLQADDYVHYLTEKYSKLYSL
jgi:carboxypeptidase Taq